MSHRGSINNHRHHRLPARAGQFLLLLLNEESMHGYQLNEVLEERKFVKKGRFKTGSLHTILNRMEEKGARATQITFKSPRY